MKTKLALLLVAPALLLSACTTNTDGKEIKEEEAQSIMEKIAAKVNTIKNVKFDMSGNSSSTNTETGEKSTTLSDLVYYRNESGDVSMTSHSNINGEKSDNEVYLVNDETYIKVLYQKTKYDGQEAQTTVLGYEGNEMAFSFASLYFMVPESYITTFSDPTKFDTQIKATAESTENMSLEVKYYSKGEENLTIKYKVTYSDVASQESETVQNATYTVKYNNGLLAAVKLDQTSNKNNKSVTDMKLEVKDEVVITLPAGWEDLINKSSSQEE